MRVTARCRTEWFVSGDVVAVAVARDGSRLPTLAHCYLRYARFLADRYRPFLSPPERLVKDCIGALPNQLSSPGECFLHLGCHRASGLGDQARDQTGSPRRTP